jgi:signal peptidase II
MTPEIAPPSRDYRWLLFAVAALSLGLDQWSKARIIEWLAIGDSWRPYVGTPILELFAFTHIKNMGAAFGMFQTGGWFFIIVATVVSIFIALYAPRIPRHQWYVFLALGLTMGGALGNLVDRLRLGWVTDFIHVGNFAIFNIADSSVVLGVIILFFIMWRDDEQRKRMAESSPAAPMAVETLESNSSPSASFMSATPHAEPMVSDKSDTSTDQTPEFSMEHRTPTRLLPESSSDS